MSNTLLSVLLTGCVQCDWEQELCVQHRRVQCPPVPTAGPLHAPIMSVYYRILWVYYRILCCADISLDSVMYTSSSVAAAHELVLEVFQALTSNTQIVKESIQKGMYSVHTVCVCRCTLYTLNTMVHVPCNYICIVCMYVLHHLHI